MNLPILASCDGCSACCMEQSSPPGYVYILATPEAERGKFQGTEFAGDAERLSIMPPEVVATLTAYILELRLSPPRRGERPCIWLDQEAKRCKFHEYRPSICREFERSSEACHNWRAEYEVKS